MLPGKKLKPEDFLEIAWRRRWTIAVPLAIVAITTAFVSARLPNLYESEALIQVIPPRIPDRYVPDTIEAAADDRLKAITEQVLTRARLERVIDEFNLYPDQRETGIMQDVVDRMRSQDISVEIPRIRRRGRGEATLTFKVAYRGQSPRTTMNVTERLASLFIEEGLRDRSALAEGTDRFLQSQLDEARRQLVETEQKIEEYSRQNLGALPSQLQSNLQLLQTTQTQLQAVSEAILRDRDQRAMLERMLTEAVTAPPSPTPGTGRRTEQAQVPQTAAGQLEAARNALEALKLRLKPEHPDIVAAERVVKELEAKAAAEALAQPLATDVGSPAVAVDTTRQARADDLRRQIAGLDVQLNARLRDEERLKTQLAAYQGRVEATPGRASELASLSRDYDTLKGRYNSLLLKREDARIAADLERREIGEQFRLVDPPRIPERPVSPDRRRMIMLGFLAGLGIGVTLAGLLEYRDTAFRTESDIVSTLALPVLALVPTILTSADRRRRRWRRLALSTAVLIVLAAAGAAAMLVWRVGLGGA